jgi:hypothetical protein
MSTDEPRPQRARHDEAVRFAAIRNRRGYPVARATPYPRPSVRLLPSDAGTRRRRTVELLGGQWIRALRPSPANHPISAASLGMRRIITASIDLDLLDLLDYKERQKWQ